jgi:hypothetical protein
MYQMVLQFTDNFQFQCPPKYTEIGIFGTYAILPSGNPDFTAKIGRSEKSALRVVKQIEIRSVIFRGCH